MITKLLGGDLVKNVGGIIDSLHTSQEEKDNAKIKLKEISRQFVINVFDDNLSLSYFKQSNQTVEDFFKMYNVEIRELDENETIYTV